MKIKFYDELNTIKVCEKDLNGRDIHYTSIDDCVLVGYDTFYPNTLIKSDNHDFLILPIKETFMSLKSGTVYEKTMEFDYNEQNRSYVVIEDPVFFFICNNTNYYHFLYDSLPYLTTYFKLKKTNPNMKLLMNYPDSSKNNFFPFVLETLSILGIPMSDVIIHNENHKYNTVYIGSSLTHNKTPNLPPREEVYGLFNRMTESVELNTITPKRIYISRRTWTHNDLSNIGTNYTTRRKLMNEDLLVNSLLSLGFTEVFCEKMSMEEKIHLFKNAEVVVGPIGGGMCNVLFSKPTTKVLSIISPKFMDINERFIFSMCKTTVKNIDVSYFYEDRLLKTGMRVLLGDDRVGEISTFLGDGKYGISLRKIGTTGCESTNESKNIVCDENELSPIDDGLNSPWLVDLGELMIHINKLI